MIVFKYNNKIWKPKNPEKKLKQLGITWDDVEIIKDVYDRMLLVASDETKKPIEKPVNYMNSSILKEFKKQYDVTL